MAGSLKFSSGNSSIPEQADALDGPDVWVSACTITSSSALLGVVGKGLHDLEEQLRCEICGDLMRNPVLVVPCSHTFCSSCIRAKFRAHRASTARYTTCPACNTTVDISGSEFSKCLVPNRSVDSLVHQFRFLRGPLLSLLQQQQQQQPQEEEETVEPAHTDSPTDPINCYVVSSEKSQGIPGDRGQETRDHNPTLLNQQQQPQQCTRRSTRNNKVNDNKPSVDGVTSGAVPVGVKIGNNSTSQPAAVEVESSSTITEQLLPELDVRRKKLSRTIYRGLKKKDLQELCRREGLSTYGSDKDLQHRHTAWIDKYNAECDSLRPRAVAELRQELEKEERDRAAGAFTTSACGKKELACVAKLFARLTELGKRNVRWKGIPSCGDGSFDAVLAMKFEELIHNHRTRFPGVGLRRRSFAEIKATMAAKEHKGDTTDNATGTYPAVPPTANGEASLDNSLTNEADEALVVGPASFSNPYSKRRLSNPVESAVNKSNKVQRSLSTVDRPTSSEDPVKATPVVQNHYTRGRNSNDSTTSGGSADPVLVKHPHSVETTSGSSRSPVASINPCLSRRASNESTAEAGGEVAALCASDSATFSAVPRTDGATNSETSLEDSLKNEADETSFVGPASFSNPYSKKNLSTPVNSAVSKSSDLQHSSASDDSRKAAHVVQNPFSLGCNSNDVMRSVGNEDSPPLGVDTTPGSSRSPTASINPNLSRPGLNRSTAKVEGEVAASNQQQNDASQAAPVDGSAATVASNHVPVDSNLIQNEQNASGSTVSGFLLAESDRSHLQVQSSCQTSQSQQQSVSSVSSSSGAPKRKLPKQNQLMFSTFASKPKRQRSSDVQAHDQRPLAMVSNNSEAKNSAFGPSWICSFCFCDNKRNPGSRARCLDCSACRKCKRCPCTCNSNECSPTEKEATIYIDC